MSNLLTKFEGTLRDPSKSTASTTSGKDRHMAPYLSGSGRPNTSFNSTSAFFVNISYSLTTYVRQHGYAGLNEHAHGTINVGAICVRVQWGGVAYAGTTTLLLLVFFGAMVVLTDKKSAGIAVSRLQV